jgi:nicotinate-nucleotide adenylyltransferase
MKRRGYFGGTFDPVHRGHLAVGQSLIRLFLLDEFVFLPAYHAPHKPDMRPTSGYHRFAMLSLATENEPAMRVSTLELDHAEKRFSVETLTELRLKHAGDRIFFVMGADSWAAITTWRDWETLLQMTDHIIVSRPGYVIGSDHVGEKIRQSIVDLRGMSEPDAIRAASAVPEAKRSIFVTDAVKLDISATAIRIDGRDGDIARAEELPERVANYIEKYELYK